MPPLGGSLTAVSRRAGGVSIAVPRAGAGPRARVAAVSSAAAVITAESAKPEKIAPPGDFSGRGLFDAQRMHKTIQTALIGCCRGLGNTDLARQCARIVTPADAADLLARIERCLTGAVPQSAHLDQARIAWADAQRHILALSEPREALQSFVRDATVATCPFLLREWERSAAFTRLNAAQLMDPITPPATLTRPAAPAPDTSAVAALRLSLPVETTFVWGERPVRLARQLYEHRREVCCLLEARSWKEAIAELPAPRAVPLKGQDAPQNLEWSKLGAVPLQVLAEKLQGRFHVAMAPADAADGQALYSQALTLDEMRCVLQKTPVPPGLSFALQHRGDDLTVALIPANAASAEFFLSLQEQIYPERHKRACCVSPNVRAEAEIVSRDESEWRYRVVLTSLFHETRAEIEVRTPPGVPALFVAGEAAREAGERGAPRGPAVPRLNEASVQEKLVAPMLMLAHLEQWFAAQAERHRQAGGAADPSAALPGRVRCCFSDVAEPVVISSVAAKGAPLTVQVADNRPFDFKAVVRTLEDKVPALTAAESPAASAWRAFVEKSAGIVQHRAAVYARNLQQQLQLQTSITLHNSICVRVTREGVQVAAFSAKLRSRITAREAAARIERWAERVREETCSEEALREVLADLLENEPALGPILSAPLRESAPQLPPGLDDQSGLAAAPCAPLTAAAGPALFSENDLTGVKAIVRHDFGMDLAAAAISDDGERAIVVAKSGGMYLRTPTSAGAHFVRAAAPGTPPESGARPIVACASGRDRFIVGKGASLLLLEHTSGLWSEQPIAVPAANARLAVFSPDAEFVLVGKSVIAAGGAAGEACPPGMLLAACKTLGVTPQCAAFHPSGRLLAIGGGGARFDGRASASAYVQFFRVIQSELVSKPGRELSPLYTLVVRDGEAAGGFSALTCSPDGECLLALRENGDIFELRLVPGATAPRPDSQARLLVQVTRHARGAHERAPRDAHFSRDGRSLLGVHEHALVVRDCGEVTGQGEWPEQFAFRTSAVGSSQAPADILAARFINRGTGLMAVTSDGKVRVVGKAPAAPTPRFKRRSMTA